VTANDLPWTLGTDATLAAARVGERLSDPEGNPIGL
jgi:hypothetical protein